MLRPRPARVLAALALALVAAGSSPAAQQTVFRSGTDIVTVDVLVTDGHGKPVQGLGADDFRIIEKGRPQKIEAFTFMTVPPAEPREVDPAALPPLADVVTNQVVPHSRAFVVVVDDLHLLAKFQVQVRRVLTDVLASIPANDRVAIVFTGRSDLSIDFTTDFANQMRAVGRVRDALGFAADPTPVVCGPKEAERQHHALGTLDVLRNVITSLTQVHSDERTVIYLSEGFNHDFTAMPADVRRQPPPLISASGAAPPPADELSCRNGLPAIATSSSGLPGDPPENPDDAQAVLRRLKALFQTADRADVRIYTIDPRGNVPLADQFIGDLAEGGYSLALQSKVVVQNDFLRTVAEQTGGLAAVTRSDLPGAVRELLADTSNYYLLGYRPEPLVRDGQYHEIEVKVSRPGVHVRFRKGYDAPAATPKIAGPAEALSAGLTSAAPAEGLPLSAFVAPIQGAGKNMRMAITVEVLYPGPSSPAPIDDDLQYEVYSADVEGKAKIVSRHAFHFAMTPTRRGDIAFLINDAFDLPPGIANLRLGVVSRSSGKVGTVSVPVRVPNPSDGALQVPSVVIGLAHAPEAVMRADAFAGLLPFQPAVSRRFRASDTLRVFAPLSWGSSEAAAAVTLTVTGGAAPVTPSFEVPAPAPATGGRRRGIVDRSVPLSGLKPGNYVLTLTARLSKDKAVTRAVAFTVE